MSTTANMKTNEIFEVISDKLRNATSLLRNLHYMYADIFIGDYLQNSAGNRLSTETTDLDSRFQSTQLHAPENSLYATSLLSSVLLRFGNWKSAISKLDHMTQWNTIFCHYCDLQFMNSIAWQSSTFQVFINFIIFGSGGCRTNLISLLTHTLICDSLI
jgi:hypothetical protein